MASDAILGLHITFGTSKDGNHKLRVFNFWSKYTYLLNFLFPIYSCIDFDSSIVLIQEAMKSKTFHFTYHTAI